MVARVHLKLISMTDEDPFNANLAFNDHLMKELKRRGLITIKVYRETAGKDYGDGIEANAANFLRAEGEEVPEGAKKGDAKSCGAAYVL